MENNEAIKTIYLESGDDVVSVIEKIQNDPSEQINLVIPKRSTLTRSVINFKILKDEAELLKKKISITTGDELGQNLAAKAGLVVQTINESGNLIEEPKQEENTGAIPSYDISDLRNFPSQNEILEIKKGINNQNINTEDVLATAAIGHVQVSDIIRKSHTTQIEPERIVDKTIKDFVLEETRKNQLSELKKSDVTNIARDAKGQEMAFNGKKNAVMVSSFTKKIFTVFVVLSLIVAGVVVFIVLPKADVSIVSKTESLSAAVDIVVDPNITAVDIAKQEIPGKAITKPKEVVQEFSSTGKKKLSEKAHGVITVYNEWSTSPQILVENTRFASKGGKIFRTKKTIVIPGMERIDGSDAPGIIDAEVEAQEAGEGYNIAADSFTIPGFAGTVKHSSIYGRSKVAMVGGSIADVLVVTSADISSARDVLIKKIESEMADHVMQDLPNNYKIINEAIKITIDNFEPNAIDGDVKDKFAAKISATATALIFSEKEVNALVGEIIKNKPEIKNKIIVSENNDKIEYGAPSFSEEGKMMLSVHVEKKVAWKIDPEQIKNKIKGKNKDELNGIFSGIEGIDTAETRFEPKWAFWIASVPNNDSRINISIQ